MITKFKKTLVTLGVTSIMAFTGANASVTSMLNADSSPFSISASAFEWGYASTFSYVVFSTSKPMKVYAISNSHRIPVYSDANLTSPEKGRYIYGDTDEIWIYSINNNSRGERYAYASYPTSSGRRNTYIPLSTVTNGTFGIASKMATSLITTYKKPGGAVYGSISAGDLIEVIDISGAYSQVIYPVTNSRNQTVAYKMAYVTTSDLNAKAKYWLFIEM